MRSATTLSIALVGLLAAVALAGCGGGGGAGLSSGDIAVVGSVHVTQAQFDTEMQRAQASYQAQKQPFPKQGTTQYETIKGQAVAALVQQAMRDSKAKDLKLSVSAAEIDKTLTKLKKQYFKGDEKKYEAELKKQHATDAEVRDSLREQLLSQKLYNYITKGVKVTDADVHQYYVTNVSQYTQAESRQLRYILVKKKSLAESIYHQLVNGNAQTWCKLAKKYAQDQSGQNCGKATFTKGQTVPAFDKVAFSAPTNKVHVPFYDPTQYKQWFIVEPIANVKPSKITPEAQVAKSIRTTIANQKKTQLANDFVTNLAKSLCKGSKIKYEAGFAASPDPCTSLSGTTAGTTTTG